MHIIDSLGLTGHDLSKERSPSLLIGTRRVVRHRPIVWIAVRRGCRGIIEHAIGYKMSVLMKNDVSVPGIIIIGIAVSCTCNINNVPEAKHPKMQEPSLTRNVRLPTKLKERGSVAKVVLTVSTSFHCHRVNAQ